MRKPLGDAQRRAVRAQFAAALRAERRFLRDRFAAALRAEAAAREGDR